MRQRYTSDVRTTLDIDGSVLAELKKLQQRRRISLGQLVSELLARSLTEEQAASAPAPFQWRAEPMGARVDLEDRDAVQQLLDEGR